MLDLGNMVRKAQNTKRNTWNQKNIEAEKRNVREELEILTTDQGTEATYRQIFLQLADLESNLSPEGQLRRFIYSLSALGHHLRHGGLTPIQVRQLRVLAEATLKTQGIFAATSRNSYLYGELHLILSQIFWKGGKQWLAAWEQLLSLHISPKQNPTEPGLGLLLTGVRALRLGHTKLACENFTDALDQGLTSRLAIRAKLERVKSLRLLGNLAEVENFTSQCLTDPEITSADRSELEWEQLCGVAQRDGNLDSLLSWLVEDESRELTYYFEAFLWTRIVKSREYLKKHPTFKKFSGQNAGGRKWGFLGEVIHTIEVLYDSDNNFTFRFDKLGQLLDGSKKLLTMEQELLLWGSALRWLGRGKNQHAKKLLENEYQSLSRKVSSGNTSDVLGVLNDLL